MTANNYFSWEAAEEAARELAAERDRLRAQSDKWHQAWVNLANRYEAALMRYADQLMDQRREPDKVMCIAQSMRGMALRGGGPEDVV